MARRGEGIYQRGRTWWLDSEGFVFPMSVSGQIGARPDGGWRRRRRGSSTAPLIVMACVLTLRKLLSVGLNERTSLVERLGDRYPSA